MMKFLKDENGQGMVEYGLIIAVIAVVIIAAMTVLRGPLEGVFNGAAEQLADPAAATAGG